MLAYRRVEKEKKVKPVIVAKVEPEKQLETVNETLSLGNIESSNKRTDTDKQGRWDFKA
jgi:hypothetical protein